jgi:hypothetical protein
MRILLINVPHPSIGSRIPDDHLPPLGLLAIGGPLIDDGHEVRLIDGEFGPMPAQAIVTEAVRFFPTRFCSAIPARPPAIASSQRSRIASRWPCLMRASFMAACFRPVTGAKFWPKNPTSPRSCVAKAKKPRGN